MRPERGFPECKQIRGPMYYPYALPLEAIPSWAHLGLNQGPLACEASALPLSYAPGSTARIAASLHWARPVALGGEAAVP